jgi:KDO2-lipid IV(A) lauroyltransferase
MRHVLGSDADEERVQAVVRGVCQNIAKGHYDLFQVSRLSGEEILRLTEIQGQEHLEAALARKKGVILASAHFGNVDLIAQVPMLLGLPIMGPAQHVRPERLFRYTQRLRQSHGVRIIPADGVLLEMYRALRRNEIVGLPCDRGIADNSRMLEFFGKPALLADGPVRLALRTGAAIVPGFAYRNPDNTFLARIEPELELARTGDLESDVAAGMRQIIEILERVISQHPEQWLVAAPVWPMDQVGASIPQIP